MSKNVVVVADNLNHCEPCLGGRGNPCSLSNNKPQNEQYITKS